MNDSQIVTITVPSFDSESNLTVINLNLDTPEKQILSLGTSAFSGLCFNLGSDIVLTLAGISIKLQRRSYQLLSTTEGNRSISLPAGNNSLLLIHLPQDFIELFRDSHTEAFDMLLSAMTKKQSFLCFDQARRMPFEILKLTEEIRGFKASCEQFSHQFYYNKIVSLLFQHIHYLSGEHGSPNSVKSCHSEIAMAEHLLKKEYKNTWTLDLLAETVGIHKRTLTNLFRQLLGTSPMNYLADFRLQKAYDLLKNTGLSITAITQKTGYTHIQSFSRAFQRKYQVSPMACRRYTNSSDDTKMLPQT